MKKTKPLSLFTVAGDEEKTNLSHHEAQHEETLTLT
jgi:hypothetical protein